MRVAAKREGSEGREVREGERWRGGEGRDRVQREEFAKMPSYGSLQQAVKVRPGRGETEVGPGRAVLFLPPRSGASVAAESGQHQPSPALRLS